MKRVFVWMVLLVSTLTISAQNKNITVTGTVIESDSREAAIQATIQLLSLPDSTYIAGAASLSGGKFTLPKLAAGNYVVKVSYIGFYTKLVPLQLTSRNTTHDMGTIALESDAVLLSEAVITAEAPPVTMKEDTTVYSASAYRVAEGSMLEDLVKKLPGAEVSEDGVITINGKEIKKIMVDGKEFFSDDPKMSMKNLPANMVENVKTYDRKSDMARITGIDDGEEEAVLDLTVKKGMKQGWIGNVIAGYGSEDRYEAGVMVSRFKDNSSISILGSANNTNGVGFSEFGDAGQGMGNSRAGAGITTSQSLGINFAKDSQKLQMGGNIQYGHTDNDAQSTYSREQMLGEDSNFEDGEYSSRRDRHNVRADFRFEWRPDTMTTILFRPNISYSNTKTTTDSRFSTFKDQERLLPVNKENSDSQSKSDNVSFNGRLQFFRKLNSKGRNLSVGGNFGYSDNGSESDSYSETGTWQDEQFLDSIRDLHTSRVGDSRNYSIYASYTEPVFKNHFLQLRYEFSHRNQLSQSLVYDEGKGMDYLTLPDVFVDSLSSRVENFYDTHTVDLSIRGIHPKMMYNAGVSVNPQSSRSETTIGPNMSDDPKRQNVLNFSPQVMFRYMFNKQHTLMFRYRGRSSAPSIEDLQQVIDQSNPLEIRYGNPNLKPSFSHNVMMFYNKYIPEAMRSYAFNMFFTATQNSVGNKLTYNPDTGGRIYERVNINGNWSARGFFSFNTPFKNRKYTLSSNTNASFNNSVSYTSLQRGSDAVMSTTRNFRAGERLTGSYRSDNFDISLNASINYDLARNNRQSNTNRETFDYFFGGSTNVTLPWQLYVSTDINYRIKDGYSGDFQRNEVIWNAQISKNFLKNQAATIRFKIYDILQQQTNLSRSVSETLITDTQYNTLGSYFMVHFVYRFNTLGGKAPSRPGGDRRGPGGRGPGGPGGRHF